MNPELIFIIMAVLSAGLFALGGTGGWKFATKAWRRFGLPLAVGACLIWLGVDLWRVAIAAGLLCVALHLPYGDKTSWAVRIGTFASYGVPSIIIGRSGLFHFNWWLLIIPIVLSIGFLGSRIKIFEKSLFWKAWESTAGLMIACSLYANL